MRAIRKDKAITNTNMYNKYVVDTTIDNSISDNLIRIGNQGE